MEKVLSDIYYTPKHPASLGGATKLFYAARLKLPDLTLNQVKKWLSKQLVYTLHFPIRQVLKRNHIDVRIIDEQFQADLTDVSLLSRSNNMIKYLLTVVDVLSKYAWAIPVKNKTGPVVAKALEDVIQERTPFSIQTDQGTEFKNKHVKELFKKYQVNHFFTKDKKIKCACVEAFNRTIKNKIHKYITKTGKKRFIHVLSDLLFSYNNSVHSQTKFKPSEVTPDNEHIVYQNLEAMKKKKYRKPKLVPGTTVRRQYDRMIFDRGFYPNWSDEVFLISDVKPGPVYKIKNQRGQRIDRSYYGEELQKVVVDKYRIEKVIKKRRMNGRLQYYVKWLNVPEYSWIDASDVSDI